MKETINQRFKKVLDEKKINQSDFAKLIGVTKQNVNNWYNNTSPISVDRIVQILEVYQDLDARWFLTGSPRAYNVDHPKMEIDDPIKVNYADKDYIISLQKGVIEMKEKEIERLNNELGRNEPGEREQAGRNAGNF